MTRRAELRNRVLRLVQGACSPEDFSRLLLWLRERSFGAFTIREVGDFIAHSDTRTKGILTKELRETLLVMRFYLQHLGTPLSEFDLPPDVPHVARMNLARYDHATLKKNTGLSRQAATALLDNIFGRLIRKDDGRYTVDVPLTDRERSVLECCLGIFLRPLFDDRILLRDFMFALEKNGLLLAEEHVALKNARVGLAFRAIEAMHLTAVSVENEWNATLHGGIDQGMLCVFATAEFTRSAGDTVYCSHMIFETSIPAHTYCDPALITHAVWRTPIEMRPGPLLRPL